MAIVHGRLPAHSDTPTLFTHIFSSGSTAGLDENALDWFACASMNGGGVFSRRLLWADEFFCMPERKGRARRPRPSLQQTHHPRTKQPPCVDSSLTDKRATLRWEDRRQSKRLRRSDTHGAAAPEPVRGARARLTTLACDVEANAQGKKKR